MITLPSGRQIGDKQPVLIIAEVGSNWLTFQDCIDSIVKAKSAGADAVKFQLFDAKALWGFNQDGALKAVGALPPEWLPKLAEKAKACGIEFMCTAFSPELYDVVDPYVSIHKIASAEACHIRILEKVKSYGKPVILSTGAKGEQDILAAVNVLGHTPKILMYCVAAYPAEDVNLDVISTLASKFNTPVGYSDHTTSTTQIPGGAIRRGACVIEKHFTVIPESHTPDRGHSLSPEQFGRMVKGLREGVPALIAPTPSEKPMILRHNRRLIATRDISVGEQMQEGENFGIYRSLKDDTHAFHPFAVGMVHGSIAKKPIAAGHGIGPGDV